MMTSISLIRYELVHRQENNELLLNHLRFKYEHRSRKSRNLGLAQNPMFCTAAQVGRVESMETNEPNAGLVPPVWLPTHDTNTLIPSLLRPTSLLVLPWCSIKNKSQAKPFAVGRARVSHQGQVVRAQLYLGALELGCVEDLARDCARLAAAPGRGPEVFVVPEHAATHGQASKREVLSIRVEK